MYSTVLFGSTSETVRFATFNVSLYRAQYGQLAVDLYTGDDLQIRTVAQIIQRLRPDVLLLNEFDYDPNVPSAELFQKNYLSVSQNRAEPIEYPFHFSASSNTGIQTGLDLNWNGRTGGPEDAFGYGQFPGQYGMLLLSRYPIRKDQIRTFQHFLWKAMPGALLPDDPNTPEPNDRYRAEILSCLRLSSKSHWDIPVDVEGQVIHCLVSHPTPPVYDGPEDRNGRRNHDEIRFWDDYISPSQSAYIVDDTDHRGGLTADAPFIILGDLNADPSDGDGIKLAIQHLLNHPRLQDPHPSSLGAVESAARDPEINCTHDGKPRYDTFQAFPSKPPGNLRLDYVLPCKSLKVKDSGVFWPTQKEDMYSLVQGPPFLSSDHRFVYVDIEIPIQ